MWYWSLPGLLIVLWVLGMLNVINLAQNVLWVLLVVAFFLALFGWFGRRAPA